MTIRVVEYVRPDGTSPYSRWFDTLPPQAAAKVTVALLRLAQGNVSAVRWFGGIGEVRIDWGPGYRVYLLPEGKDLILLVGGGTKKRQQRDITRALGICQEFRQRKRNKE